MIITEEEIVISDKQKKFIESGWGKEVLEDTEVKKIIYESDGLKVEGYLANPINKEKKYPLIVWNRGGNLENGMVDDFLARGMFGEIASWGYVVLASQYREEDEFGGKDVNDVLNLITLAENIPYCDSSVIGMEGWSRGGMMTYRVLSLTDRIKCAVIISGLADLFRNEKNRESLSNVFMNLFGTEDEAAYIESKKLRSAVYFADKISRDAKILLIHGTADNKVSHEDSVDMFKLLKERGIKCKLELIENGDHYLKKNREVTVKMRKEWFNKYLKN